MIKKVLKDNRGEAYIGHIIGIILSLVVVVFALTYYPVFTLKYELGKFASEVMREAEITGEVGTSVNNKINELKRTLVDVDSVKWDTKYISGTNKVNLNEQIKVTVSKKIDTGFFIFGKNEITISATEVGSSEVYFK